MRIASAIRPLIGPIELLHEQTGPGLLRLTRMGIVLLWLVKLMLDPLWRLADLPHELVRPVGLLRFFPVDDLLPVLFSQPGLILLWILNVLILVGCLIPGRHFAFSATLSAFLLTVYSSVIRSFGPAVHTDIVLLLAIYVLAAFACADYMAGPVKLGKPDRAAAYPLITIVAILCLCYCLVGCTRVLLGGTRVFTGDSMECWAVDAGLRGYYFNFGIGWQVPQWPLVVFMLKMGLPVITLFEITAPLCLVSSHFRWIFIPVMFSFHLLSLVFMNIFFFDDMLLYLLLVDWSRRFASLRVK